MKEEYKVIEIDSADQAELELIKQGAVGWQSFGMGNAKKGHLLYFKRDAAKGAGLEEQYQFNESQQDQLAYLTGANAFHSIDSEDPDHLEILAKGLDEKKADKDDIALIRRKAKAIRVHRWPPE